MCSVKTPKVKEEKEKKLPVIRNPILDGMLGNIAAIRNGRNALRIDLLNPLAIPKPPGTTSPSPGGGSPVGPVVSTPGSPGGFLPGPGGIITP